LKLIIEAYYAALSNEEYLPSIEEIPVEEILVSFE